MSSASASVKRHHQFLRASTAFTTVAATMVAAQPAQAQLLPANVVNVCSGVNLKVSDVTGIVSPLLSGVVNPLVTNVNEIFNLPLLSALGNPVTVDVAGLVTTQNATGQDVTLKPITNAGTAAGSNCASQAAAFTLNTGTTGITVGGNQISGLGNGLTATAGEVNSIAFGNGASTLASAANAVAVGTGAAVEAANSVALGTGSKALRGAQSAYAALGLGQLQTSAGEVSVGVANGARQLTNLAAGSAPTDAVNVAQLTGVSNAVTALAGQALQYVDGTKATASLGGTNGTLLTNVRAGTLGSTSTDAVNGAQLSATNDQVSLQAGRLATVVADLGTATGDLVSLTGRVGTAEGDLATLGATVGGLDTALGGATGRIDTLTSDLGALAGTVTDQGTLIDTANAAIDGVNTALGTTTARVNTLASDLGALAGTVTSQGTLISTANAAIDDVNAALGTTTGRVNTLASDLGALAGTVTSQGTLITAANSAIDDVNAALGATTGRVNTLASDLGTLASTVTDQGTAIGTINGAITGINTALGTATDRIDTLAGTVTSQGTLIDTANAAIGDVNATLGATSSRVNTLAGDLDTLAGAVGDQGVRLTAQANLIDGLQANVAANVGDIAALDQRLGQQQGTIDQHGLDLANLTDGLGGVASNLGTLAQTVAGQGGAISGLQANVAANVGDIAALNLRLGQQQGAIDQQGVDLSDIQGALGTLQGIASTTADRLAGLGDDLTTVANSLDDQIAAMVEVRADTDQNSNDLATLTASVTGHGAQLALNTNAITNLTTGQTTLAGNVTNLTTNLTELIQTVAGHGGTLADLSAVVGGHTQDISDLDGRINVQANVLTSQSGDIDALRQVVTGQGALLNTTVNNYSMLRNTVVQHGDQIVRNTNDIASLRNMQLSANTGPLQFIDPANPLVASATVTGDAAILGANGAVKLHNIGAGVVADGSTDAVNGGQLNETNVAVNLLSGRVTDQDNVLTNTVNTLNTTNTTLATLAGTVAGQGDVLTSAVNNITNVSVELSDLTATVDGHTRLLDVQQGAIDSNLNAVISLRRDTANGAIGPVQYSSPLDPLTPNGGTPTNNLTLVGAVPGAVRLHNVAAGTVGANSTDAVNGGQLFALSDRFDRLTDLAVSYDDASRGAVSLGGGSVPVGLRNVLAGRLSATSTDAVNGGQLFATNQRVQELTDTVAAQEQSVTNLFTEVTNNTTLIDQTSHNLTQLTQNIVNGELGPVRYADAEAPTVPNAGDITQRLTLVGAESGPVALANLAAGTLAAGSTEAVNGGQLVGLGASITNLFGGDTIYSPVTNSFSTNLNYGGNTYSNVQQVFGAVEQDIQNIIINGENGGGGSPTVRSRYFNANSDLADSRAAGKDSTAVGPNAISDGTASVAIGRTAWAGGDSSVAIGDGAKAQDGKAVSIGLGNIASGDGAVAIGDPNFATGEGAVALGKDNMSTGLGSIALGNTSAASGDGAAAIGNLNQASGQGAVALGDRNVASGFGAIAMGSMNNAIGAGALSIGVRVSTSARDTLAIGTDAAATSESATAIGNRVSARGIGSVALGDDSDVGGHYATGLGALANAAGLGSTALGYQSVATGFGASALGAGAIADRKNSIALGGSARTTRGAVDSYAAFGVIGAQASAGELAIAMTEVYPDGSGGMTLTGERQLTGLAAGSAATDAVNVAQLRGVSGSVGGALAGGLGGGASYDAATGAITGPRYTFGGATYTNVGDALSALASNQGNGGNGGSGSPGAGTVVYADNSQTIINLAPEGTVIRNVADGNVSIGSKEAVNGGQLAEVSLRVEKVANGGAGVVQYSDAGNPAAANGGVRSNSATLVGADPTTPVSLHNVAAGRVAVGSTDAVNGGQLAETNARVDQTNARVATLAANVQNGQVGVVRYAQPGTTTPSATASNDATLVGADANAPVALRNVADGRVAAGSTDAVNGGQLAQVTGEMTERMTTVESKTSQALAMGEGSVQYDNASRSSVSLGGTSAASPVALRNVAAGTTATDAVNLGQLGNAMGIAVGAANAYTDRQIAGLKFDLAKVNRRANAGVASAMAMAGMPQPYEAGRGMIAGSVATFGGQTAIAIGASKAFEDGRTVMKLGATYNSRTKVGATVGVGYQF